MKEIKGTYNNITQEATFTILGDVVTISNPADSNELWGDWTQTGDVMSLYVYIDRFSSEAEFYMYATEKVQGQNITLWNHFLYIGRSAFNSDAIWTVDYDFNTFDATVVSDGNTQTITNPNGDIAILPEIITEQGKEPTDSEIEIRLGGNKLNCEMFLYPIESGARDVKSEFYLGEFLA